MESTDSAAFRACGLKLQFRQCNNCFATDTDLGACKLAKAAGEHPSPLMAWTGVYEYNNNSMNTGGDAGCEDRSIVVWNLASKQEVARWAGHTGLPTALKWAPRRMLVASADTSLAMWIPNIQEMEARGIKWLQ